MFTSVNMVCANHLGRLKTTDEDLKFCGNPCVSSQQAAGLEPASGPWKSPILPLNYACHVSCAKCTLIDLDKASFLM